MYGCYRLILKTYRGQHLKTITKMTRPIWNHSCGCPWDFPL